jgi:chromosome segregation ATPase
MNTKLSEIQDEIRELYDTISDLSEKNFAIYKDIELLYNSMSANIEAINKLKFRLGWLDMEATKLLLTEKTNQNAI